MYRYWVWASVAVVVIAAAGFGVWYWSVQQTGATPAVEALPSMPKDLSLGVTHAVSKGVHVYAGSLVVPACSDMSAGLRTEGEKVYVDIVLTEAAPGCTSLPTGKVFTLSYEPAKGVEPVFGGVTINGVWFELAATEEGR